jgi:hypothetical protein
MGFENTPFFHRTTMIIIIMITAIPPNMSIFGGPFGGMGVFITIQKYIFYKVSKK